MLKPYFKKKKSEIDQVNGSRSIQSEAEEQCIIEHQKKKQRSVKGRGDAVTDNKKSIKRANRGGGTLRAIGGGGEGGKQSREKLGPGPKTVLRKDLRVFAPASIANKPPRPPWKDRSEKIAKAGPERARGGEVEPPDGVF